MTDDLDPTPADKAAARAVLDKPDHKPKPNDPRDQETKDGDISDPSLQEAE